MVFQTKWAEKESDLPHKIFFWDSQQMIFFPVNAQVPNKKHFKDKLTQFLNNGT